mgnify:CR=1 FL=1
MEAGALDASTDGSTGWQAGFPLEFALNTWNFVDFIRHSARNGRDEIHARRGLACAAGEELIDVGGFRCLKEQIAVGSASVIAVLGHEPIARLKRRRWRSTAVEVNLRVGMMGHNKATFLTGIANAFHEDVVGAEEGNRHDLVGADVLIR